jgi:hypothetical protein
MKLYCLLGFIFSANPLEAFAEDDAGANGKKAHFVEVFSVPERLLDLGIGDVDGQGTVEFILLSEDRLDLFAIEGGNAKRIATRWARDLPKERHNVRNPAGKVVVADFNLDGRSEVFYKWFDRRQGEILAWNGSTLQPVRSLNQVPLCVYRKEKRPMVVYGMQEVGTNRYLPRVDVSDINDPSGNKKLLPEFYTNLQCWQSQPDGVVFGMMVSARGELFSWDMRGPATFVMSRVGDAAAVCDFEQDGKPDYVITDRVLARDRIRVVSGVGVQWQSEEWGGMVSAVTVGDVSGKGKPGIVCSVYDSGDKNSHIYTWTP